MEKITFSLKPEGIRYNKPSILFFTVQVITIYSNWKLLPHMIFENKQNCKIEIILLLKTNLKEC